jgi:hypothetical protein
VTEDRRSRLLEGVSQYDVDFVNPRLGVDIPLGIDPFLLYKSRDPNLRALHAQVLGVFNAGIKAVADRELAEARRILDFPEVPEIGFGYAQHGKRGSGVGERLSSLVIETVMDSPSLQRRGVKHVEEMQLLSAGIGPDRVSDIAANILKRFLIGYTHRQCRLWGIPLKSGVPVSHVFDTENGGWADSYEEMPVSPLDGSPILLVPRRWVRSLPWINYDDFSRTEFRAYLAARRDKARSSRNAGGSPAGSRLKQDIVTVTRRDIALVDRYVQARERRAADAVPELLYIDEDAASEAETLLHRLEACPAGRERAADYQRLVLEILNFLFNPDLIDGSLEEATAEGTERRDIVFTNDSDEPFWAYVRTEHSGLLLMFETKNTLDLDMAAVNQTATYLGDRLGRLGVIVTRQQETEAVRRKLFSVWNDSSPRKVILVLADEHLKQLLALRSVGKSTTKWMQQHYRRFRTEVQ